MREQNDGGRVMIFGGRGQMGCYFRRAFAGAVAPAVDIADRAAVAEALRGYRPHIVINCAGKTGRPNVDWCETHKAETLRANVTGPLILAEECLARGAYLAHLGSGCIYEGDNGGEGFGEDDAPNFAGSFYSRTKAWSEQALREFPVLVLRLRMPFDGTAGDRNLIMKLRKYPRVLTVRNSITHVGDFMRAAKALILRRATGVFNVVNEGAVSPFEIMSMYRDLIDPSHEFEALPTERLGEVAAAGRSNCTLSTAKLRGRWLGLPSVHDALRRAMCSLALELDIRGGREMAPLVAR